MKCEICGAERNGGYQVFGVGFVCSEKDSPGCIVKAKAQQKAGYDEARAYWNKLPDSFDVPAFEMFGLCVALLDLDAMPPADKKKLREANPIFLIPEELAAVIKEKVLAKMPREYYCDRELRGHERMFASGEYWFLKPVPKAVVLKAAVEAGFIQECP